MDDEAGSVFDLESYADLGGVFNSAVSSFSWNGETFTAWSVLKEAATLGEDKGISSLGRPLSLEWCSSLHDCPQVHR